MNFVRIDGYPDYVIHPNSCLLRIRKNKTTMMKHYISNQGYCRVQLSNKGVPKKFTVHRLLAIHFIENPENKPTVDHINRIKTDNRIENLRWATMKEQCLNRIMPIKIITKGGISKNGARWQWQYYMNGVRKYKYMKSKESLEIYRKETLKKYNILI